MSDTTEALDPLFERTRDRLELTRARFEAQARRYRTFADAAHPDFKQRYLDLAHSVDAYLKTFSLYVGERE